MLAVPTSVLEAALVAPTSDLAAVPPRYSAPEVKVSPLGDAPGFAPEVLMMIDAAMPLGACWTLEKESRRWWCGVGRVELLVPLVSESPMVTTGARLDTAWTRRGMFEAGSGVGGGTTTIWGGGGGVEVRGGRAVGGG